MKMKEYYEKLEKMDEVIGKAEKICSDQESINMIKELMTLVAMEKVNTRKLLSVMAVYRAVVVDLRRSKVAKIIVSLINLIEGLENIYPWKIVTKGKTILPATEKAFKEMEAILGESDPEIEKRGDELIERLNKRVVEVTKNGLHAV